MRNRALLALVFLALVASGCSSAPPATTLGTAQQALQQADAAAQQVSVQASASTGIIRGVVVDEAIRPIAGAAIALQGTGRNTTSNTAGGFGFGDLEPGTHFLLVHAQGHADAKVSVQVEAGRTDPEPVRVQLTTLPTLAPYVEVLHLRMFVTAAVNLPVVGPYNSGATSAISPDQWSFYIGVDPNATVIQFEYDWQAGNQLAVDGQGHATTYTGSKAVIDDRTVSGPSPLVLRLNATGPPGSTQKVAGDLRASPSAGYPVGAMANQDADCYIHLFHNFTPRADWVFGRDGDYPVPPSLA